MSVTGFPKKNWIGGWVGGFSSIKKNWDFLNFFIFEKPLRLERTTHLVCH